MRGIEIDFFIEETMSHSSKEVFGLCDDNDEKPAYIDEDVANKDLKWIGKVCNTSKKEIKFYPVDNCVAIWREEGKMAERCEGLLSFSDNKLVFVELKDREPSDTFRKKAEEQLLVTMRYFFNNYDKDFYQIKAWIANKQLTNQNYFQQIAGFKEKTKKKFGGRGFVLYVSKSIEV